MSIQIRQMSNDEAYESWSKQLCEQAINHRHAAWSIGDLMLEGDRKFDADRVTHAMEATGMTFETLQNYKSIAKAFPIGRRRLNVGITIHGDIRALDVPIQDGLLDLVEKHEINRADLRERIKAVKSGDLDALKFKWKPKNAVREFEDSNASVSDEDKPIFDSTGAGEGMAADRHDDLEVKGDNRRSANEELDAINRAIQKFEKSIPLLNLAAISGPSLQASMAILREVSMAKARHDQAHIIPSAASTPVSNTADQTEAAHG